MQQKQALTYDIHFDSSLSSDSKGFKESVENCRKYIDTHNGTNNSYFGDYRYEGAIVSIVCNETGETVYSTQVN